MVKLNKEYHTSEKIHNEVSKYLIDGEFSVDIPGYEGLYCVTNYGRIYSFHSNKFLKLYQFGDEEHLGVQLCKNGTSEKYSIHRLVADIFIDNPQNLPVVNHKNENPQDNSVENLEWCTQLYNVNYGTATQRRSCPVYCPELDKYFNSIQEASKETGVAPYAISALINGNINGYHFEKADTPEMLYKQDDYDDKEWYTIRGMLHFKDKEKDKQYQQLLSSCKDKPKYKRQKELQTIKQKEADDKMFNMVKNLELKEYGYKEVCDILNEKRTSGKSRQYQLKRWKRFFSWENTTSRKYNIIEIYDAPKEKEDKRKNNGGARNGAGRKPSTS